MSRLAALTVFFVISVALHGHAQKSRVKTAPDSLRYLALGDSYTVGYLVNPGENFPNQLVRKLRSGNIAMASPELIAHNGWNSRELLDGIAAKHPRGPYDLVTLLIGVNNQYRGYALPDYEADVKALLRKATALAGKNTTHVVMLSIPDWSLTPFAADKSPKQMALEVGDFNAINKKLAAEAGVTWIDLADVYAAVSRDPEMTETDGLHPSAKMYALWVEKIARAVQDFYR
ncbi:MAG: SGNH/GDSL hydrolase family protein [Mucilaginibacter polytrichastri]|nr:SGNH/GDSL hydrolase family protein [Mucilaginibacter polytrichastri]